MIAALLAVKKFANSKHRLAGLLSPTERMMLARTMFEDVWAALREALASGDGLERLLVVSAEPFVVNRCRQENIPCLEETEQASHSHSVNRATEWARSLGVASLLSLPIDTPGVTAAEILVLLEQWRQFAVVIVPSADGSGTNALLRTPPHAIAAQFGPNSCRLHQAGAEAKRLSWQIFRSPGLVADVDTPEDLESFLNTPQRCRTRQLAERLLLNHRRVGVCR